MGLNLDMGFGTRAAFPGTKGTAANASPQGPTTASSAAWGTTVGASAGLDAKTGGVLSVGTLALAALVYIWWSLPR